MRPRGTRITAGGSRLDIEMAKRIGPATAAAIASTTPIASRRPEAPAKVPAAIASPTPWQIARKRLMSAKRLAPHTQTGRRPSGFASAEAGGSVAPREPHLERAVGLDVQLRAAAQLRALRVHDDPREVLRVEPQDVRARRPRRLAPGLRLLHVGHRLVVAAGQHARGMLRGPGGRVALAEAL